MTAKEEVTKVYPGAICVDRIRGKKIIVPGETTNDILGEGLTEDAAWESASRLTKGKSPLTSGARQ